MQRTLVLLVVGLAGRHLGKHTPRLSALAEQGKAVPLKTVTPAVTCSVQSTMVTGTLPREHGIVGNGWYFRDLAQVWLWRQSNALVHGEKIWDAAKKRDDRFTCAKMFWWYNMYSTADWSMTPRPIYRADGAKLPDAYSDPPELRDILTDKLGTFPLFDFWGPRAGIKSSRWIADATRWVYEHRSPTLTLCYLPHLDYDLQKYGPDDPRIEQALQDIDEVAGALIDRVQRDGTRVIVVSEYGITKVRDAVHINRALRRAGFIAFREELGEEHFDAGDHPRSGELVAISEPDRWFSYYWWLADHQVAHVYVRNRPSASARSPSCSRGSMGSRRCSAGRASASTASTIPARRRAGGDRSEPDRCSRCENELRTRRPVAGRLRPQKRSSSARWRPITIHAAGCTVDIHAKPGYDPVELFVDPEIPLARIVRVRCSGGRGRAVPVYIASRLVRRKLLNQRALLDVSSPSTRRWCEAPTAASRTSPTTAPCNSHRRTPALR